MNIIPWLLLGTLILLNSSLSAEIVLDGTLGARDSLVGPDFLIQDTMGQQVGGNLFHSFESFSVNAGESATFSGSNSVTNIISRVTGENVSLINGLLRSEIADANLYFLNPNGIFFGEQASLDIQGALHLSTADVLYLGTEGRFDATKASHSILTVAPPSHFGFLTDSPADITIQGSFLRVPMEKSLSITAGDLQIQNAALYAPDGRINLVSVASKGEVVPNLLNTADKLGTIMLSQSPEISPKKVDEMKIANIDTSGMNGGQVFIQGGQFLLSGGWIAAQVAPDSTQTQPGGITIETQAMILRDNSSIDTETFGNSNGGDIAITATDSLTIIDSGISVASAAESFGNAGNLQLQVGQLTLQYGGFLNSGTLGSGTGGNINITATEGVSLFGQNINGLPSLIASSIGDFLNKSAGQGGDISITTPRLELKNRGAVQTGAFGFTNGNAGNIFLNTNHLIMNELGTLLSSTMGSGSGGNIEIVSTEMEMNHGLIHSGSVGEGNAGSINISTQTASFNNVSIISTSAIQAGGGNVEVQVQDRFLLLDSGIIAHTEGKQAQHHGGNLTINQPQFFILNNSQLNASAYAGNGGNIRIVAEHVINSIDNVIDASSEFGMDGKIEIISLDKEMTENFTILPSSFFDASQFLSKRCADRLGTDISHFFVTGTDILPEIPHALSVHIPSQLRTTLFTNAPSPVQAPLVRMNSPIMTGTRRPCTPIN